MVGVLVWVTVWAVFSARIRLAGLRRSALRLFGTAAVREPSAAREAAPLRVTRRWPPLSTVEIVTIVRAPCSPGRTPRLLPGALRRSFLASALYFPPSLPHPPAVRRGLAAAPAAERRCVADAGSRIRLRPLHSRERGRARSGPGGRAYIASPVCSARIYGLLHERPHGPHPTEPEARCHPLAGQAPPRWRRGAAAVTRRRERSWPRNRSCSGHLRTWGTDGRLRRRPRHHRWTPAHSSSSIALRLSPCGARSPISSAYAERVTTARATSKSGGTAPGSGPLCEHYSSSFGATRLRLEIQKRSWC